MDERIDLVDASPIEASKRCDPMPLCLGAAIVCGVLCRPLWLIRRTR